MAKVGDTRCLPRYAHTYESRQLLAAHGSKLISWHQLANSQQGRQTKIKTKTKKKPTLVAAVLQECF